MAQEVEFGNGGAGKIRSFWVGLLLVIVTLGIYYWFWYYFLNDEQKDIGQSRGDQNLATSSPALSVAAVTVGGIVIIPPFLSVYNFGQRIKRAQRLTGVPTSEQINPILAFLTYLFGFLIIPALYHYWYVTKHQNRAILAAGGRASVGGGDARTLEPPYPAPAYQQPPAPEPAVPEPPPGPEQPPAAEPPAPEGSSSDPPYPDPPSPA
jgi:hypothetical protein